VLQGIPCRGVCSGVTPGGDGHGCLRCRVTFCTLRRAIDRRSLDVSWLHVALDVSWLYVGLGGAASGDVYKHVFDVLLFVRRGSRGSRTGASSAVSGGAVSAGGEGDG
jgi:hypothetical protein